jgi:hypothetical protein
VSVWEEEGDEEEEEEEENEDDEGVAVMVFSSRNAASCISTYGVTTSR